MKTKLLLLTLVTLFVSTLNAQVLMEGAHRFSSKKDAYLTLMDGTEVVGTIKDVDRKKGLIEEIKLKDANGKKLKFKPEDVKFMYLPVTALGQAARAYENATNLEKQLNGTVDDSLIKDGYVYFETTDVMLKKKKKTLLLQVLNPLFSNGIKVYFDPYAKETMKIGVGGPLSVGGKAKSYYVKRGNEVAFRLKKKDYKEEYMKTFKKCKNVITEYGKKGKWNDLAKHTAMYSENCGS